MTNLPTPNEKANCTASRICEKFFAAFKDHCPADSNARQRLHDVIEASLLLAYNDGMRDIERKILNVIRERT